MVGRHLGLVIQLVRVPFNVGVCVCVCVCVFFTLIRIAGRCSGSHRGLGRDGPRVGPAVGEERVDHGGARQGQKIKNNGQKRVHPEVSPDKTEYPNICHTKVTHTYVTLKPLPAST